MASYLISVTASKQEGFNPVAPVFQIPGFQQQALLDDIIYQLHAREITIVEGKKIPHGVQLCLSCGAFISIFHTGKVLLQGKLSHANYYSEKALLLAALPANTSCCL